MSNYRGESAEKQIARNLLYEYLLRAPRRGKALILAGNVPGLPELELLGSHWSGSDVIVCDYAKDQTTIKALLSVPVLMPGARSVNRDVCEVLQEDIRFGLVNLDFMGGVGRRTWQAISHVGPRLLRGATLGLTWLRAREHPDHPSGLVIPLGKGRTMKTRRWSGIDQMVRRFAEEGGGKLELMWQHDYMHGHSPMSVGAWVSR